MDRNPSEPCGDLSSCPLISTINPLHQHESLGYRTRPLLKVLKYSVVIKVGGLCRLISDLSHSDKVVHVNHNDDGPAEASKTNNTASALRSGRGGQAGGAQTAPQASRGCRKAKARHAGCHSGSRCIVSIPKGLSLSPAGLPSKRSMKGRGGMGGRWRSVVDQQTHLLFFV